MHFLITGGTGFIGRQLCSRLLLDGHVVTVLTRDMKKASSVLPNTVTLVDSLETLDKPYEIIINLAGESIGDGRWTKRKKQRIYDSRLYTTEALIDYIARVDAKPHLLISGSAIGYYGHSLDVSFTEDSEPADEGFTHTLCRRWEALAHKAESYGVRVCCLRTGIVLGTGGGALSRMLLPFKLGLGGVIGHGKQWMSWIHMDDLIGIILHVIQHSTIRGPVNGTAPTPVINADFTRALGQALHRPTLLPLPAFHVKLLFGEMGDTLLLHGQRVLPRKALDTSYAFLFSDINAALEQVVR